MSEEKIRLRDERQEIAGLDEDSLRDRLNDEKKRLWNLRFEQGKRQLDNTAALSATRQRIARILTQLRALENKA